MNLTEFEEQAAFVEYLSLLEHQGKIQTYTALPNNLYTKSWKQKTKQKKEGLRPGFPDLCIVTNKQVVFIEMKRKKGGTLSAYQKEWIASFNNIGIRAKVCKGFDEAKAFIDEILEEENAD